MNERRLVRVGDVLDLPKNCYLLGTPGDLHSGTGDLRVRIRHLPPGAEGWTGHWLSLTAVEILPDGTEGAELSMAVHRLMLPGYEPVELPPGWLTW